MLHDPCCNTFDDKMNDLMMFCCFDDSLTDGWTTLVVKSLSRLKSHKNMVGIMSIMSDLNIRTKIFTDYGVIISSNFLTRSMWRCKFLTI